MNPKQTFVYFSSPEHWFQTALELDSSIENLVRSSNSEVFYQKIGPEREKSISRAAPSKAILLLMAYSLENLLKGLHVLRDASLVNKGKIDSKIATHELNNLVGSLNINLTEQQVSFQKSLSEQCISNARYPVGRNENLLAKNPSFKENEYKIYKSLFEKYKWILVNEFHEFGWKSGLNHKAIDTLPKEFNYIELE